VNTADTRFALSDTEQGADLQAVMTHEVGHYIGLAHSFDPDSIMVARYCQNQDLRCGESVDRARSLSNDDVRAVCAAYGPGSDDPPASSSGGCSHGARLRGGSAGVLGGALLFLGCAVVLRRRRRGG
jgi:hypothetical protein